MTELFRRGEVLPEGRTTEEEEELIGADQVAVHSAVRGESSNRSQASHDAARGGLTDEKQGLA